jgi:hypothetical protein
MYHVYIQRVRNVCVHLMITVQNTHNNSVCSNNPHTIDDLKMAITECTRNADRAMLNTDCAVLNTDRAILNTDRAILNTDRAIMNTDRAILNTVFENSSACQ